MTEEKKNSEEIGMITSEFDEAEIDRISYRTIILSKEVEYMGEKYTKLTLNFEALTGRDMESIDEELTQMNVIIPNPNISHKYQRLIAAKAAKVPSDMIEQLPLRDYQRITTAARRFLLATA